MRILIDGETVQVINPEYVDYRFVFHPTCRYGEATQIEVIDDINRNFHYTNQYILDISRLYEIQIDRHNVRVIDTRDVQEIRGVIPSRIRNNEFEDTIRETVLADRIYTNQNTGSLHGLTTNAVWYDDMNHMASGGFIFLERSMDEDWTDCSKECEHEFVPIKNKQHLEKCKLCGEKRLIIPKSLDKINDRLHAIG